MNVVFLKLFPIFGVCTALANTLLKMDHQSAFSGFFDDIFFKLYVTVFLFFFNSQNATQKIFLISFLLILLQKVFLGSN